MRNGERLEVRKPNLNTLSRRQMLVSVRNGELRPEEVYRELGVRNTLISTKPLGEELQPKDFDKRANITD
jgi:hypothetical protein